MSSEKNDENSMERFIEKYKPVFNHFGCFGYQEGTIATLESDDLYSGIVFGYSDDEHWRKRDEFIANQDDRYVWAYRSGRPTRVKTIRRLLATEALSYPTSPYGYIIATVPYEDGDPEEYLD